MVKGIAIVCALALAVLLVPAVAISSRGFSEDIFRADVGVVLGNEVNSDGTPSPRLAGRLDRAVELYAQAAFDTVIVSGGKSETGLEEADVMRRYLIKKGVPESAIVTDTTGINTRGTAVFTADYMREHGMSSAIVITQFYHIARSVMALKSCGVDEVGSSYARYYELHDIFATLREIPAIFAYSLGLK